VNDILAIVDAEGNKAAAEHKAEDDETTAEQPAETTSLINGCGGDGSMTRGAHAHNRGGTQADWLNWDRSNRSNIGNRSRSSSICNRLGRSSGISNRLRLTRRHFSCVGIHGRHVGITIRSRRHASVIHIRSRSHFFYINKLTNKQQETNKQTRRKERQTNKTNNKQKTKQTTKVK